MTDLAETLPPDTATPARRGAALARIAVLALGLVLAGWLLRQFGAASGEQWVDRFVRGQGVRGEAVFVLGGAAIVAVGAPRQTLAFLGGYAFGGVSGTLLTMLAQLIGCAIDLAWARLVGGAWITGRLQGRFGSRIARVRAALAARPFRTTLALRLLPVGSNLALNLLAGLGRIPVLPFLAASAIGYLPQTLIFVLLGEGVAVDRRWQLGLGAGLLVVSVLLGFGLLRRNRATPDGA